MDAYLKWPLSKWTMSGFETSVSPSQFLVSCLLLKLSGRETMKTPYLSPLLNPRIPTSQIFS